MSLLNQSGQTMFGIGDAFGGNITLDNGGIEFNSDNVTIKKDLIVQGDISYTGDLDLNDLDCRNLNVQGTATFNQTVVINHEVYQTDAVTITCPNTSTKVPLSISATGTGTKIISVTDTDNNKTFEVNNNCDIQASGNLTVNDVATANYASLNTKLASIDNTNNSQTGDIITLEGAMGTAQTNITNLQTKTQLQSANSGATTFTGRTVYQGTNPVKYILADPNGDYSSGVPSLNVGYGADGLVQTDTITCTGDLTVQNGALTVSTGDTTVEDLTVNGTTTMNNFTANGVPGGHSVAYNGFDLEVTGGIVRARGFAAPGDFWTLDDDGLDINNGAVNIDENGVITGTKIILNNTDSQWNGANGNLSTAGTVAAYSDVTSNQGANSLNAIASQVATNTSNISSNTSAIATKLSLSGGTMSGSITAGGDLFMNSHKVSGLAAGTLGADAVTLNQLNTKQNTITTGTTSQYFKGDLSLGTAGNLISKSTVNNKCYWVSANGSSSNDGLSEITPMDFATALTSAGNSGNGILVTPGTYAGNFTISNLNVDISSVVKGGICYFSGTLTFSHSSSSNRLKGISVETITHSGSGGLYLDTCNVNTSLSHSGAGYLEVMNSNVTSYSGTGTGQVVFTSGSKIYASTINNSSKIATFSNLLTCGPITITSCLATAIGNLAIISATDTSNAVTMAAGSLILDNVTLIGPSGGSARMALSGGTYSIRKLFYDKANSSFSGATRSAANLYTDLLNANAITMTGQIDMGSNKLVNVSNPTSAQDCCTKYYADNLPNVTGSFIKTDGTNSMSANLNLNSNKVVNVANGTTNTDAVNKSQLDTKLNLSGGTLTGTLNCNGNLNVGGFSVNTSTGNISTGGTFYSSSSLQAAEVISNGDSTVQGNLTVGGDLTINGTTTTANSTVNEYNGYVSIVQNPADGTNPALSISQGGTSSGPIFQVVDSDTNVILNINQSCDINLNSGKFTVASSTGNVSSAGTITSTGNMTCGGVLVSTGKFQPNSAITIKNVSSLPGSGNSVGDVYYNTSDDQIYVYNGFNYVTIGSFTPTISNAVNADSLFYRNGAWLNGFYTDIQAPSISGQTLTFANLSSPYSYNGSSSMYIQVKAYSDSGLTNLVYTYAPNFTTNFWSYTYGTGNNLPSYSTTYYLIARVRSSAWANSWSDWSNTFTVTTPPQDAVLAQLTTSASAYISAPNDSFVAITSTEYNNILNNIGSVIKSYRNLSSLGNSSTNPGYAVCDITQTSIYGAVYCLAMKCGNAGNTGGTIYIQLSPSQNSIESGKNYITYTAANNLSTQTYYYYAYKHSPLLGDAGQTNFWKFATLTNVSGGQYPFSSTSGVSTNYTTALASFTRPISLGSNASIGQQDVEFLITAQVPY